jgi:hypothetical protein
LVSKGVLSGVIVTAVAVLLITSSFALIYFNEYQQEVATDRSHVSELNSALASYKTLQGSYDVSLRDYNRTLSLLALALANMNTSSAAYKSASAALASLWSSYQTLASVGGRKAPAYQVHMLVDFGNGTRRWYNNTSIQPGWNGYIVTLVLMNGRVQATWYPPGYFGAGLPGAHFVSGIGGVSSTQTKFWFILTYSKTTSWQVAQVGADEIPIFNGTVFAWTFCSVNSNYGPACPLP